MALANVVTAPQKAPMRELVYGVEGIGKTQFAAAAPSPIFLGAEDGAKRLAVGKFPVVESWGDVLDALTTLETERHSFRTLVIDTLDSLEPHLWRFLFPDGIEAPGYGKGYTRALEFWQDFARRLEWLQRDDERRPVKQGMHVLLLAHAHVKKYASPDAEDFDRYTLKLHEKAASFFREWCESVLFASYKFRVQKTSKTSKAKGSLAGRWLYTQKTAAFDAKNRYGLPAELPLDFAEFWKRYEDKAPEDATTLREEAVRGIAMLKNPSKASVARAELEKYGSDHERLRRIVSRIATRLEEQEEASEEGQPAGTAPSRAQAGDPVTINARVDGPASPENKATTPAIPPAQPPTPTPAVGVVAPSKAPGVEERTAASASPLAAHDPASSAPGAPPSKGVPFSPEVARILDGWGYSYEGWSLDESGRITREDYAEISDAAAEQLGKRELAWSLWLTVGLKADASPTVAQAEQLVALVERARRAVAPTPQKLAPVAAPLAAGLGVPPGSPFAPDEYVDTETGELVPVEDEQDNESEAFSPSPAGAGDASKPVPAGQPFDPDPTPAYGTTIPPDVQGMRLAQPAPKLTSCKADEAVRKDPVPGEGKARKPMTPAQSMEDVLARIGRTQVAHASMVVAAAESELVPTTLQEAVVNLLTAIVTGEKGPGAVSGITAKMTQCGIKRSERWTGGALRNFVGRFAARYPKPVEASS